MDKDERIAQLEEVITSFWRDIDAENADCCYFCKETITADVQDMADGSGWDFIEHDAGCIVLTIPRERR